MYILQIYCFNQESPEFSYIIQQVTSIKLAKQAALKWNCMQKEEKAMFIDLFKLNWQEQLLAVLQTLSKERVQNPFTYKINNRMVQVWLHLLAEEFMRKLSILQSNEDAFGLLSPLTA